MSRRKQAAPRSIKQSDQQSDGEVPQNVTGGEVPQLTSDGEALNLTTDGKTSRLMTDNERPRLVASQPGTVNEPTSITSFPLIDSNMVFQLTNQMAPPNVQVFSNSQVPQVVAPTGDFEKRRGNTKRSTLYGMRVWNEWRREHNKSNPHLQAPELTSRLTPEEFNLWSCKFVKEVHRRDRSEYPADTLRCICFSICRYLRDECLRSDMNFMDGYNPMFKNFRRAYEERWQELSTREIPPINSLPQFKLSNFTEKHENKLWEKVFALETAQSYSFAVYFYLCKLFDYVAAQDHLDLQVSQFQFDVDADGEFLKINVGKISTRRRKRTHRGGKVYAVPDSSRCVVKLMKRYIELIQRSGEFYRRPLPNGPTGNIRFSMRTVGINRLRGYIREMFNLAGIQLDNQASEDVPANDQSSETAAIPDMSSTGQDDKYDTNCQSPVYSETDEELDDSAPSTSAIKIKQEPEDVEDEDEEYKWVIAEEDENDSDNEHDSMDDSSMLISCEQSVDSTVESSEDSDVPLSLANYSMKDGRPTCKYCNRSFMSIGGLKIHLHRCTEDNASIDKEILSTDPRVQCWKCNAMFSTRSSMKRHEKKCGTLYKRTQMLRVPDMTSCMYCKKEILSRSLMKHLSRCKMVTESQLQSQHRRVILPKTAESVPTSIEPVSNTVTSMSSPPPVTVSTMSSPSIVMPVSQPQIQYVMAPIGTGGGNTAVNSTAPIFVLANIPPNMMTGQAGSLLPASMIQPMFAGLQNQTTHANIAPTQTVFTNAAAPVVTATPSEITSVTVTAVSAASTMTSTGSAAAGIKPLKVLAPLMPAKPGMPAQLPSTITPASTSYAVISPRPSPVIQQKSPGAQIQAKSLGMTQHTKPVVQVVSTPSPMQAVPQQLSIQPKPTSYTPPLRTRLSPAVQTMSHVSPIQPKPNQAIQTMSHTSHIQPKPSPSFQPMSHVSPIQPKPSPSLQTMSHVSPIQPKPSQSLQTMPHVSPIQPRISPALQSVPHMSPIQPKPSPAIQTMSHLAAIQPKRVIQVSPIQPIQAVQQFTQHQNQALPVPDSKTCAVELPADDPQTSSYKPEIPADNSDHLEAPMKSGSDFDTAKIDDSVASGLHRIPGKIAIPRLTRPIGGRTMHPHLQKQVIKKRKLPMVLSKSVAGEKIQRVDVSELLGVRQVNMKFGDSSESASEFDPASEEKEMASPKVASPTEEAMPRDGSHDLVQEQIVKIKQEPCSPAGECDEDMSEMECSDKDVFVGVRIKQETSETTDSREFEEERNTVHSSSESTPVLTSLLLQADTSEPVPVQIEPSSNLMHCVPLGFNNPPDPPMSLPQHSEAVELPAIPASGSEGELLKTKDGLDVSIVTRQPIYRADGYLECEECGRLFNCTRNYNRHYPSHLQDKRFKCEICDKTFHLSYHLKEHMNKHFDLRPYKCHLCGKAYNHSGTLSGHLKVAHRNENIPLREVMKCKLCSKVFAYEGTYYKHLEERHSVLMQKTSPPTPSSWQRVKTIPVKVFSKKSSTNVAETMRKRVSRKRRSKRLAAKQAQGLELKIANTFSLQPFIEEERQRRKQMQITQQQHSLQQQQPSEQQQQQPSEQQQSLEQQQSSEQQQSQMQQQSLQQRPSPLIEKQSPQQNEAVLNYAQIAAKTSSSSHQSSALSKYRSILPRPLLGKPVIVTLPATATSLPVEPGTYSSSGESTGIQQQSATTLCRESYYQMLEAGKLPAYQKRDHQCKYCEKSFDNKLHLTFHMTKEHQERSTVAQEQLHSMPSTSVITIPASMSIVTKYKCILCLHYFLDLPTLTRHITGYHRCSNPYLFFQEEVREEADATSNSKTVHSVTSSDDSIPDLVSGDETNAGVESVSVHNASVPETGTPDIETVEKKTTEVIPSSQADASKIKKSSCIMCLVSSHRTIGDDYSCQIAIQQCPACNESFVCRVKNELRIAVNAGSILHQCPTCWTKFKYFAKNNKCKKCDEKVNPKRYVVVDGLIRAEDSEEEGESGLESDVIGIESLPFICQLCNCHFYQKINTSHVLCCICNEVNERSQFVQHMNVHKHGNSNTKLNTGTAQECKLCLRSVSDLETHLRTSHRGIKDIKDEIQKQNMGYHCKKCEKVYDNKHSLKRHYKLQHCGAIRCYKCDKCSKSFQTPSHLVSHIQSIHLKIRQFQCSWCQKKFTHSGSLSAHKRYHCPVFKHKIVLRGKKKQ